MQVDGTKRQNRRIGVIMLNTHFPRLLGDVGNPETFSAPFFSGALSSEVVSSSSISSNTSSCETLYRRVDVATVDQVISDTGVPEQVSTAIFTAAKELDQAGVDLIVTSCGFLGELQGDLEQQISTPVLSSSLALIPLIRGIFGEKAPLGVITFNSQKLKPLHFNGHYDERMAIQGVEQGQELHRVISQDLTEMDEGLAREDVIQATKALMEGASPPKAIILECTNLSPYIDTVREQSQVPVFDLIQGIRWLVQAHG